MKRQGFRPNNSRGGTTLTEVLMSLLCMGIGVVAVASLFPIALLRSVQATQLTSATILRFNAETLIDLYDVGSENLILNPDYDPAATIGVDPDFREHFGKNYLIDPLGAMIVRDDNGRPLGTTDKVGKLDRFDAMRIFYTSPTFATPATAIKEAENIVMLPDSWVTLHDEFPVSNDNNSVVLPSPTEVDTANLDTIVSAGQDVRILLFSSNGKISESRLLTTASFATAGEISWADALPANNEYFPDKVERIRLEVRERRFTWLLTVRNDTPGSAMDATAARARVDVVVFFRRSPTIEEETPFLLTKSGKNYLVSKIDQDDWEDAYPSVPYPDPYPDPFLKKGGFMLDSSTGEWHRLQKANSSSSLITLEKNVRTLEAHHAVFMKGVVDVFPLGSKP
jgi:hypothetical protein